LIRRFDVDIILFTRIQANFSQDLEVYFLKIGIEKKKKERW